MLFEVPVETPSLTNQREHWSRRSRRAKQHRRAVYYCWRIQPDAPKEELRARIKAGGRVLVTLVRRAPCPLDSDNLTSSLKHVRDQIAQHLGVDDRDPRVLWAYGQDGSRTPHVVVRVEPAA